MAKSGRPAESALHPQMPRIREAVRLPGCSMFARDHLWANEGHTPPNSVLGLQVSLAQSGVRGAKRVVVAAGPLLRVRHAASDRSEIRVGLEPQRDVVVLVGQAAVECLPPIGLRNLPFEGGRRLGGQRRGYCPGACLRVFPMTAANRGIVQLHSPHTVPSGHRPYRPECAGSRED
jgi:hypothetical protein